MGIAYSTYYDLVKVRELGPEVQDWAVTDKNFQTISAVLKALEQHEHTGFPALPPPSRQVTISIANPAVITLVNHGLVADQAIQFYTTGYLPTGLARGTTYYVLSSGLTANTFEVSISVGGTPVATSGTESGVQSIPMRPILTEGTAGGSLAPGVTVGVRLSYLNAAGLETQATTEMDITLSPAALRPLTPLLLITQPQNNALSGGTYMYVITKVKGTGETLASDALPVTIPFDFAYEVTIGFDAISSYTDGTTQLNVYRSSGLNSSFQLVAEITDINATGYTDTNTAIDQTQQPPGVSTFDSTKMITIDWASLGVYPTAAAVLNIYVTQQSGIWGTSSLLTSIPLTMSTPTTYNYLGSETLRVGYPYESTQIPDSPSAIGGGRSSGSVGAPPVGVCIPYTGSGDPPMIPGLGQWVIADGRLVDATTYSGFFNTTGHAYNGGVDPGGGQVRIPDKRGVKSVGAINMGSAFGAGANDNAHLQAIRGGGGGEVTHQLTESESASHGHDFFATSTVSTSSGGTGFIVPTRGTTSNAYMTNYTDVQDSFSNTLPFIQVVGGDGYHNNMDPYQADSYIVRIL